MFRYFFIALLNFLRFVNFSPTSSSVSSYFLCFCSCSRASLIAPFSRWWTRSKKLTKIFPFSCSSHPKQRVNRSTNRRMNEWINGQAPLVVAPRGKRSISHKFLSLEPLRRRRRRRPLFSKSRFVQKLIGYSIFCHWMPLLFLCLSRSLQLLFSFHLAAISALKSAHSPNSTDHSL